MSTGADLETAIASAAKHYRDVDRCELQKQHTPRLHSGVYQGKSSVDFKGFYRDDRIGHDGGRQPLYVEAKATSDSKVAFADDGDGIRSKQLDAMRDAVTRCIHMLLVVDFVPEKEVYVIDVRHVVEFADKPWRKSLSLYWCRAYGELAKVSGEGKHRRVWFLDSAAHPLQAGAYLATVADKARCEGATVVLFPEELTAKKSTRQRLSDPMPPPNTESYRQRIMNAADAGMRRQMGTRKKTYRWKGGR